MFNKGAEYGRQTGHRICKRQTARRQYYFGGGGVFKVFGDPTRAKIMSCLAVRDLFVNEIAEVVGMSVSAVSHQLRVLRSAKLVKASKIGKEVKYCLDDNHVMQIIECGITHINEE